MDANSWNNTWATNNIVPLTTQGNNDENNGEPDPDRPYPIPQPPRPDPFKGNEYRK